MLKLTPSPRPRSAAIPANVTTLSVSWLNDQFKAIAVHRGAVEGTWERPGEIEGTANFDALLREAVEQTGYRGLTASLVLGHPRLAQQLVDVPPVKGSALNKVVQRQAQQQKIFDGEAAWAYQPSLSTKGAQRVVLHLFPKPLLNQLLQAGDKNDLHLTSVSPPTVVLHEQLQQLPLDKEEIALLAAETGGATTVVIGRADGQILLARTLSGTWNDAPARLAVDLNRTLLFINQQFGVAVNSVWLFGPGAKEKLPEMAGQIQLPTKLSPVEYHPFYWATEAPKLAPARTPNLISLEQQQAPQRQRLFQAAVALAILLVIASVAASAYLMLLTREAMQMKQVLTDKKEELQARHQELQRRHADLAQKEEMVKLVIDSRPPPVPGWFLAYLSEAVPAELVVTNLAIKRDEELWRIQLAGRLQANIKQSMPAGLSNWVSVLASRLANGPFHVKVLEGSEKEKGAAPGPGSSSASFASWVARLTSGPSPTKMATEDQFVIEGMMR